ncbi:SDR family oxidoreductase [Fervidibacillus albus]|uniref:Thioester reductase (TE) domain-containing protein n=1 Tax=Fervidibacillus albus TaxID=2980026 RepID=A0A9E8RWV5_9BACI|nr:SDR family oxidoreductase [Fervidibacillus albus]WAA10488.1 hypothetical protein OE104_03950 [Fervidibacillus albus]
MKSIYFFTGFPGFVADRLISALLKKRMEDSCVYVLVLPSLKKRAESLRREWMEKIRFFRRTVPNCYGRYYENGSRIGQGDRRNVA